jgi:O-antigen ligase
MSAGGFALLLLSIGLWRQDTSAVWGQNKEVHLYRFTATLFNANAAACLAGCFGLLALGLGYTALRKDQERARFEAWVTAAAAGLAYGLAGWAVLLAASRTSLVSLALLTAAFIGLALLRSGDRVVERRETWLLGGGGLLFLAVAGLVGGSPIASRAFESDDMDIRIATWRIVLDAISERPMLGHGLGSFGLVHQAHITVQNAAAIWDMNAAHQAFLQTAMEGGVPFSLLLTAIVALVMGQGVINWITPKQGRWSALSVMFCLTMILLCGSVDIALNVPAIASLFGLLLGALWSWSDAGIRGRGMMDTSQFVGVEA